MIEPMHWLIRLGGQVLRCGIAADAHAGEVTQIEFENIHRSDIKHSVSRVGPGPKMVAHDIAFGRKSEANKTGEVDARQCGCLGYHLAAVVSAEAEALVFAIENVIMNPLVAGLGDGHAPDERRIVARIA